MGKGIGKCLLGVLTMFVMFYFFLKSLKEPKPKKKKNVLTKQEVSEMKTLVGSDRDGCKYVMVYYSLFFLVRFSKYLTLQKNDSRKSIKSRVGIFQHIIEILVVSICTVICKEGFQGGKCFMF